MMNSRHQFSAYIAGHGAKPDGHAISADISNHTRIKIRSIACIHHNGGFEATRTRSYGLGDRKF
jgi:hypothetical protein